MIRRFLLVVVLVGGGAAAGYLWRDARAPTPPLGGAPVVQQNHPEPGNPPVLWIAGTIREVATDRITIQEGAGPTLELTRFAGGATRFHRMGPGGWRRIPPETAEAGAGEDACVEALLDEGELLAIRVFLEATCSPALHG
jgi:hypothetical protein